MEQTNQIKADTSQISSLPERILGILFSIKTLRSFGGGDCSAPSGVRLCVGLPIFGQANPRSSTRRRLSSGCFCTFS